MLLKGRKERAPEPFLGRDSPSLGKYWEAFAILNHTCALPSGFVAQFPSAKI